MKQFFVNVRKKMDNRFTNKKLDYKTIFNETWSILKTSPIFITFALLNVLLPIFICLISSQLQYGAYITIGVGYVTTFQLAFSQMGFTFSVFVSFLIYKSFVKHKENKLETNDNYIYESFFLTLLMGLIFVPLYIGTAYIYTKYANAHVNTIDSLQPAYNFIYSSSGFIFLTTFRTFLAMMINNNKKSYIAVLLEIFSVGLMVLLTYVFTIHTSLSNVGIGLGLSIGSLVSVIVYVAYSLHTFKFAFKKHPFKWNNVKEIILFTWRQTFLVFTIQAFKAIALLSLSIKIPDKIEGLVPLDFQMARLVWYNAMYLIPFFIMGMIDTMYFYYFKNDKPHFDHVFKIGFVISLISVLITIVVAVIVGFLILPLSQEYTKQMGYTFDATNIEQQIKPLVDEKVQTVIDGILANMSSKDQVIIKPALNALKRALTPVISATLKDKFISFNPESINSMINLTKSNTFIFLSIYCVLYPCGMLLNSMRLAITKQKPNWVLLPVAQALAITFVVEFGITYQTTTKFFLMDAWSFPLSIIGVIAFTYLTIKYIIATMNYYWKENNQQKIITINNDINNQDLLLNTDIDKQDEKQTVNKNKKTTKNKSKSKKQKDV